MYVRSARPHGYTYESADGQAHTRGAFLILASSNRDRDSNGREALYACVRSVALRQLGHFMMGSAHVGGERIGISGAYGSDGLPEDFDKLTERARACFVRLPESLAAEYWESTDRAPNPDDWSERAAAIYLETDPARAETRKR